MKNNENKEVRIDRSYHYQVRDIIAERNRRIAEYYANHNNNQ